MVKLPDEGLLTTAIAPGVPAQECRRNNSNSPCDQSKACQKRMEPYDRAAQDKVLQAADRMITVTRTGTQLCRTRLAADSARDPASA